MSRALQLARKGEGRTSPNPLVGAVVVKNGRVVGEGFHKKAGAAHGEIEALRKAGNQAKGADLYVNLEPCCHFGKTPPCTRAIIAAGIKKVVIGMRDPNELVLGKGIRELKKSSIAVIDGVLKRDCERLNEVFMKFIQTRRPFVTLKSAISLDGKIATRTGESRWITGAKAREKVHQMRDRADVIVAGAGTVVKDDPFLTTRLRKKSVKHPVRVILDNEHLVPLTANVFKNSDCQRVLYAAGKNLPQARKEELARRGVEVLQLQEKGGGVDLQRLMKALGEMQLTSVLIEGGGEVNASALAQGVVDKVIFFIAPILIGGKDAPGSLGGPGIEDLRDAFKVKNMKVTAIGKDWMVEGYL